MASKTLDKIGKT